MTTLVADLDGSAALRAELADALLPDPRYTEPGVPAPIDIARWRAATRDLHHHAVATALDSKD